MQLLLVILHSGLHHFLEGDHLPAHAALDCSTFLDLDLQLKLFSRLPEDQVPHLAGPFPGNSLSIIGCLYCPRAQRYAFLPQCLNLRLEQSQSLSQTKRVIIVGGRLSFHSFGFRAGTHNCYKVIIINRAVGWRRIMR